MRVAPSCPGNRARTGSPTVRPEEQTMTRKRNRASSQDEPMDRAFDVGADKLADEPADAAGRVGGPSDPSTRDGDSSKGNVYETEGDEVTTDNDPGDDRTST